MTDFQNQNLQHILNKYGEKLDKARAEEEVRQKAAEKEAEANKKPELNTIDMLEPDGVPIMMPEIEEEIPLPSNARDAMPELTPAQELEVRAATIKLISDLTGEPLEADATHKADATMLAQQMISDPTMRPTYANYPNETIAFLAGMVAQTNHAVVEELADLKLYVVNNLIKMAEIAKSDKDKIAALKAIGEIDGVDAFKKRSEVTVKQQSIEEVEAELYKTLQAIRGKVIEGEIVKDE